MATTLQDLQPLIDQLAIDLTNFNLIVNGSASITVTLQDGSQVPTVTKVITDAQTAITNIQSQLQAVLTNAGNSLAAALRNAHTYETFVVNSAADMIIGLDNLVSVVDVSINGLAQGGDVYTISGNTVTIPASVGFNIGDEIVISYFTSI